MCTNDTTCKLYIGSNYCGIYCSTGEDIEKLYKLQLIATCHTCILSIFSARQSMKLSSITKLGPSTSILGAIEVGLG